MIGMPEPALTLVHTEIDVISVNIANNNFTSPMYRLGLSFEELLSLAIKPDNIDNSGTLQPIEDSPVIIAGDVITSDV